MKVRSLICLLLIITIIGYVIALVGNPLIFIVFSAIALLILIFLIFLLATNLILKFIPLNIRKIHETSRIRFKIIILACFIFWLFGGWAINYYLLPEIFHPKSLLGNGAIFLFTIFLEWSLIKQIKKRILLAGTAIFILFIFILNVYNPNTYKHDNPLSLEELGSLPYLKWVPAEETVQKKGVTKYDPIRSFKGLNIYFSRAISTAYLMDMSGNIVHAWSADINKDDTVGHVKMCENGDLLSINQDKFLIRLDWDSKIKWVKKIRAHHDIAIAENKDIYVLDRRDDVVFYHGLSMPILNDYIVVLSQDGKTKKEISLYKLLKKEITFDRFINIYLRIFLPKPEHIIEIVKHVKKKDQFIFGTESHFDILHNNSLIIINKDIKGLCKKGNLLISVRNLDLIFILDIKKEKIIWKWGPGNVSKQHHPTMLKNGNILIFDNGYKRKYSRIIELNPLTQKIVWEYKSKPLNQFYSATRGACQRLPNGNTLITESDKGRVFEIMKNGEVVWEFYNPQIKEITKERVAIYRMMRITDPEDYSKLSELE